MKTHLTQTHCYGLLVCFITQGRSFLNSHDTRQQCSKAGMYQTQETQRTFEVRILMYRENAPLMFKLQEGLLEKRFGETSVDQSRIRTDAI